jgi:hypothetical protein
VFEAVKKVNSPPLDSFADWLYGAPSAVVYESGGRSVRIVNAEGVIQGESMASWLFDITYSRMLQPLREQAADSGCSIVTFHDDTYVLGPPEPAFALYDQFRPAVAPHGLIEQPAKSVAFCRAVTPAVEALAHARKGDEAPEARVGVGRIGEARGEIGCL